MNRGTRGALVAMACGALVGIPALARAQPQDPAGSFVAHDLPEPPGGPGGHWDANGDASSSSLAITAGGTVTFSYPAGGTSHHTVVFTSAQAPACTGLPAPGNPFINGRPGWSGSCRFDDPGTFTFVCEIHPAMTGKVTVADAPTPTATATATAGATPTPSPGNPYATPTPVPGTPQATLRGAVTLAAHQRGTHVRGSIKVQTARARLEVALSVRRSVLTGGHSAKLVRVGRWRRTASDAGRVAFSVPLTATGRAALAKLRRLPLTVAVSLTPPGGRKLKRTLHTTLTGG
jgi:hypothetical protein